MRWCFGLLVSVACIAQAATVSTVTTGPWDLYAGSRRVARYDTELQCLDAAKALATEKPTRYGCRTITAIVVAVVPDPIPEPEPTPEPEPNPGSTIAHGKTYVVTGSGFGAKAPPVVWDNCTQAGLSSQWSGAWPSRSGDYNLKCRAAIRGIAPPHARATMYLAGAHGQNSGADAGYNVMVWKTRQITSYPAYTYAAWYQRSDDAWAFCGDNNYKAFDFSMGTSPYTMPENWYIEYNDRPTSRTSGASWHLLDDSSQSLTSPDAAGRSWWWDGAVNPMSGAWTKIEVEIKYSRQADGYIKLWENGRLKINYRGRTDGYPGSTRTDAIGGYARCRSANNWRYFADLYLDYSPARVVLGNASTLDASTRREIQIPKSWTSERIEYTANLGAFKAGETVYEFVLDASGTIRSTRKLVVE